MSKPVLQRSYSGRNETIRKSKTSHKVIKYKKNKSPKFNFRLAIFCAILAFWIIPTVFSTLSDHMFLNKMRNSSIKIDDLNSYVNQVENYLYNNLILNQRFILGVNDGHLMEDFKQTSPMPVLSTKLRKLAASYPTLKPELFVWDFQTGKYVDINASTTIPTASMIKIPVLVELFKNIDAQKVYLDDTMVMTPYFRSGGSGTLQYRPDNTTFSIDFLAEKMITESDNTATNMLVSKIGGANQLDSSIKGWGIESTYMKNWLPDLKGTNYSTPHDMAKMLYNIDSNHHFLSQSSKSRMFDYMSHVENTRLLKAGLPPAAKIIHKTGDIGTVLGDAGIVYMPNGHKYIVVAMVRRPWNAYAGKEFIVNASKIIYNSFESNSL